MDVFRWFRKPPNGAPEEVQANDDVSELVDRLTPHDRQDDWLERLLDESELDHLMTQHTAGDFTPAQRARVGGVVREKRPRQARFNLLMTPQLIPGDLRDGTLLDGLEDPDPYMRLAACVGVQHSTIDSQVWPPIRDALLKRLADDPTIANRAGVALAYKSRLGDGAAIAAAAASADDGSLTNLLAATIRAGEPEQAAAVVVPRLLAMQLPPAFRTWLEGWVARGSMPPEDPPGYALLPSLAYIPNMGPWPRDARAGSPS